MNTKYISDEFTNLNCLQTKGISISLIPKHATTNLVRFFIGTGANGKNNDSKYSRLFKNTAYDISQHKPLIVVTRNETERWCSGVVQELNAYGEVFEQKGIAKNNPQKPHIPPKNSTETIITTGCRLFVAENNIGDKTFPSNP